MNSSTETMSRTFFSSAATSGAGSVAAGFVSVTFLTGEGVDEDCFLTCAVFFTGFFVSVLLPGFLFAGFCASAGADKMKINNAAIIQSLAIFIEQIFSHHFFLGVSFQ